jgi:hypothetical protein
MVIEEKDFKLELNEANHKFDLYLLYIVNAKNPEKRREEFKLNGHGMSLKTALDRVIKNRIKNKQSVIDLKTYIKMYIEEVDKLSKIVHKIDG